MMTDIDMNEYICKKKKKKKKKKNKRGWKNKRSYWEKGECMYKE